MANIYSDVIHVNYLVSLCPSDRNDLMTRIHSIFFTLYSRSLNLRSHFDDIIILLSKLNLGVFDLLCICCVYFMASMLERVFY